MPLHMRTDSVITEFCYNNPTHKLAYALLNRKHPILVGELVINESLKSKDETQGIRIVLDLIIEELKIGFVSGNNKNPLKDIYYYNKGQERNEPFKMDPRNSSFIIPEKFQERILRLYRSYNSSHKEAMSYWEEIKK